MYNKVHRRLTLLCAGITAVIMIVMSLCYLYVSERGLYRNQFQSFQNDINTITTNLEQQSVISMEWLSKMEAQGNYLFFVLDNGVPFLYNQLNDSQEASLRKQLLSEALDAFDNLFIYDPSLQAVIPATSYVSFHLEYEFVSSAHGAYYASVIRMGQNASLEIIVLSSLASLERQIQEQRIRFVLIDLAAILLLSVFSWFFTGKLLKPIVENQLKQVQFVASASHELKTPLAVILSAAECCRNADADKQQDFLKIIRQEVRRVSALVNDMLTLSQSDNHYFTISPQPIELDTLLMNSYETFEPLARDKDIALSIHLPREALPACPADPERLSQVIAILLHNAISYTPAHGAIDLSLSYEKNHFLLSVMDNGIGISKEDKKKIFDRFYRAERSRSTKGHFGLGLSIASEIVRAHGGSIAVTDTRGGGSTFTVVL
ncbi:MAG: HAMP domain-containing histidine kinase [Lachnospiraceae bacterium]|nr:HAMP domain-containing histidine kinase [Lachnospiraceae bacterium]